MSTTTGMERLAANCARVRVGGKVILYSYSTPVAVWTVHEGEIRRYVLKERISATTSKHLRQHGPEADLRPGDHLEKVTAAELERLLANEEG